MQKHKSNGGTFHETKYFYAAGHSDSGRHADPPLAAEPDEEKGTAQEAVQEEESAQADGTEAEESEPEPEPDPEGTVTWGNLDDRIRAESLNARILIENITESRTSTTTRCTRTCAGSSTTSPRPSG